MQNPIDKLKNLGDAGFLLVANLVVNIGNYGLNIVLGRWLGPEGFADANLLATLVMLLSFVAMGLQLVIAKFSAEFNALDEEQKLSQLVNSSKKLVLKWSLIVTVALVMVSPWLKGFFHFNSSWAFIILIVGIPSYFLMSLSRGYFQGLSNFRKLGKTYLVEMVSRVVVTIGLIAILGKETLSAEAVAIGFLCSFIITHAYTYLKSEGTAVLPNVTLSKMVGFFAVISIYELSQILINNSDVILVKHFFENTEAGLYASLALLGRAVFFATWIIVTMLFPKVIEREKRGESHQHLFWNAFAIVGLIGTFIVATCFLLDDFIIHVAFGSQYQSIAHLLWMYALSTTLFACANVVVYYNMSLENYLPVWISVAAGIIQIASISLFHQSLEIVIQVQLIIMAVLLGIMILYQKTKSFFTDQSQIKLIKHNQ